jgi:hypothetical protein
LPEAPVHVPAAFCAPLIDILLNMSVYVAEVKSTGLVFVRVNVIVDVPPGAMVDGLKALAMVGWV